MHHDTRSLPPATRHSTRTPIGRWLSRVCSFAGVKYVSDKYVSDEKGQGLVEFALTVPVLLILLLATFDLGMGFASYIALTNSAREGARWISIFPDDSAGALTRVNDELDGASIDSSRVTGIEITPAAAEYRSGDQVTVRVIYNHPLLFGSAIGLVDAIEIESSATMRVLYDP